LEVESSDMTNRGHLKNAQEILGIAGAEHDVLTGEAEALPLPIGEATDLKIAVLYYSESTKIDEEVVYPPQRIVVVDPIDGEISDSSSCSPEDFDLSDDPVEGFGLDPNMSADEFWEKSDRLLDISVDVWEIYRRGTSAISEGEKAVVREYDSLFKQVTKKPLLPYYTKLSPEFLSWIEKALS